MNLKRIYRYIVIINLSFFLTLNLPLAWGEPVTTIRDNGDPTNRVDFVILGDGYTAGELTKYADDVENAVNEFFNQEPYKEYQKYFNVHRVDVISNESGADHPPVYKDTAFDATYNCAGIQRLICVNVSKVYTVLSNSVNPDQRDTVLVLVNDTEYGGSGGAIAVASTHSAVIELVLHETGHSFGLLADEYDYGTCNNTVEPWEPNVTMETNRNLIKWNIGGGPPTGWIDPATPIPTVGTSVGIPGLYEGAQYCFTGKYRPTFNSKMRSLNVPFEQINEEQLVKRVYNWVSPIDSSSPSENELTLQAGESQLFQVEVLEPLTHSLDVKWYVDDQYKLGGLQFNFDSTIFGQGLHTVQVKLRDYTSKVRYDPANVLIEQRGWDLVVVEGLVYTTVTPCRIVDTRNLGGVITPSGLRSYNVRGAVASQGGNPAGCTSPQGEPRAVHLNVAAVPVAGQGHLRLFPYNTPTPNASMLNYSIGAGNMANAVSVKTCYLCTKDLSVRNYGGTTHVVIDVMGYYYQAPTP